MARRTLDVPTDGKVIGRIYERGSEHDPPGRRWLWSITTIVPAIPNKTNGYASTRDEAMQKFRTAWDRWSGASASRRTPAQFASRLPQASLLELLDQAAVSAPVGDPE